MTGAMENAFRAAGMETDWDRALRVGTAAWEKHCRVGDVSARRSFVRESLTARQVLAALNAWNPGAATKVLDFLLKEAPRPIKKTPAQEEEARELKEYVAYTSAKDAIYNVVKKVRHFDYERPKVLVATEIRSAAIKGGKKFEKGLQTSAMSRIYSYMIDGRPVADLTTDEVLAFCNKAERECDWLRSLCHGVPPNTKLGLWYGSDSGTLEVEELWRRAHNEEAAQRREYCRNKAIEAYGTLERLTQKMGAQKAQLVMNELDAQITKERKWVEEHYYLQDGDLTKAPMPWHEATYEGASQ